MTASQFKAAVKLAMEKTDTPADLAAFDGFGLPDFAPVFVTLAQVAGLIRWQAVQLNGVIDNEALATVKYFGRARFNIVG